MIMQLGTVYKEIGYLTLMFTKYDIKQGSCPLDKSNVTQGLTNITGVPPDLKVSKHD
jgi:hypothetical protein